MAGFEDRDRIQRDYPGVTLRVIDESTYALLDTRREGQRTVGQNAVLAANRDAGSDTDHYWYQTTAGTINGVWS